MRSPSSGRSRSNRSRMRRRTGISRSAHSIRRTPSAARPRSVTSWAGSVLAVVIERSISLRLKRRRSGRGEVRPRRAEAVDEPLLEADVLGVAEAAIGVERGRVVGADVEHDLVARPQQLGGHGAGDGGREAAAAVVDVGQHVADDREPARRADDVGPGGGHEPAVDAHPVVDAVGDRPSTAATRRSPSWYSRLSSPISTGSSRWTLAGYGRNRASVDPHPDHRRPGVDAVGGLDRGQRRSAGARRTRPAAG